MAQVVLQNLQLAANSLVAANTIPSTIYPRVSPEGTLVTSRELLLYFLSMERQSHGDDLEIDSLIRTDPSVHQLIRAVCDLCRTAGLSQKKRTAIMRSALETADTFDDRRSASCLRMDLTSMPLGEFKITHQVQLWFIPTP